MINGAVGKRTGMLAGLLAGLCLTALPALADQGWLPVVSTAEAAPHRDDAGRDVENGWYPVLIQQPRPAENRPPQVPSPVLVGTGANPLEPSTQNLKAAQAQPAPQPSAPATPPAGVRKPAEPRPENSKLAEDYCANIVDAAADARFAWQKRTLSEMEKELERRIIILETRTAEYREWLARRDAFVKKAQETLVGIYARMRPDAAASQLAAMDEETAAAVLTKLNPRNASAILNEMPPNRAARLTTTIAGAAKINPEESTVPAAGGGRS